MGNMDKSRFRVQIYQINYKILVLLYYTLFRRCDLFRSSFASAGDRLDQSYCTAREELGG